MSTATITPARPNAQVGERVALGRYSTATSERVIYGQRINGVVRITDCPAGGAGRAYLVERQLERDGAGAYAAVQALVADYLDQARSLGAIPMARSQLRHEFDQLR